MKWLYVEHLPVVPEELITHARAALSSHCSNRESGFEETRSFTPLLCKSFYEYIVHFLSVAASLKNCLSCRRPFPKFIVPSLTEGLIQSGSFASGPEDIQRDSQSISQAGYMCANHHAHTGSNDQIRRAGTSAAPWLLRGCSVMRITAHDITPEKFPFRTAWAYL